MAEKSQTGYPSIDKPWLKYYTDDVINAHLPECTIYDYLWENNKNNLKSFALNYFGKKITYGELFKSIQKTAMGFSSLGVKQGDIVTIFSTNTPETVFCIYALNYIGAIANMEYVTQSSKEAISAVEKCNSRIVVILDIFLSKFAEVADSKSVSKIVSLPLSANMPFLKKIAFNLKTKVQHLENEISFSKMLLNAKYNNLEKHKYIKDYPAIIVHSGGTTGTPKGVVLSNDNLVFIAWAFCHNDAGFLPNHTYMHGIPPFHAFGIAMGLVFPLCCGMQVYLTIKFEDKILFEIFKKNSLNHLMCSSSVVSSFINDAEIKKMNLSNLIVFGLGGCALSNSDEKDLVNLLESNHSIAKASIGYGMSELSSDVCVLLNRYYRGTGSVGIPLPKTNIKILDPDSAEELKYGEDGELCFSSPGLMLEYFKNKKETNSIIHTDKNGDRWIHTGDIGHIDEDGFVYVTGRIKRIYSTRAEKNGTPFKIFPDYVTNIIDEVENVKKSAVVCIEDPDYKNIGIAFVVLIDKMNAEKMKENIITHLQSNLPTHSIPKHIFFVDELPLTPIGKVDYRALEQKAEIELR